jgi:hypothetical protein
MLYLHGGDDVHVGAGFGGAAEAAGVLVEAEDELRRLVQDVVVLVHERVAHLRARANRIESARRGSRGLGGRIGERAGEREREEHGELLAYHLRRGRRRSGDCGGGRRRRHGGEGREGLSLARLASSRKAGGGRVGRERGEGRPWRSGAGLYGSGGRGGTCYSCAFLFLFLFLFLLLLLPCVRL